MKGLGGEGSRKPARVSRKLISDTFQITIHMSPSVSVLQKPNFHAQS
jgi:hypothetical protein